MLKRLGVLVATLVFTAAFASSAAAQSITPTIYVGPNERDGFVDMDAGVRDSIRDIKQKVPAGQMRVVSDRASALLNLIVLGRGVVTQGSAGFTSAALGFGLLVPNDKPTVTAVLRVQRYERLFQSEGGTWTEAAESVVKDVLSWWDANRDNAAFKGP